MAYKEPNFNKAGARALMQALGEANSNIVKRHKSPTARKPKKAKTSKK